LKPRCAGAPPDSGEPQPIYSPSTCAPAMPEKKTKAKKPKTFLGLVPKRRRKGPTKKAE
jgi:hypothetical protein